MYGADVLAAVCAALDDDRSADATTILVNNYPFKPVKNVGRNYSEDQSMRVFCRDGFTDRYTGARLVFPGALRLIAQLLPFEFPFHPNWKTDACHFAFWELFPTIDHLVPVSRGGADDETNWITTSMLRNAAKANFTIDELGWQVFPPGSLDGWDGLTGWFVRQTQRADDWRNSVYLRRWAAAAARISSGP